MNYTPTHLLPQDRTRIDPFSVHFIIECPLMVFYCYSASALIWPLFK